MKALTKKIVPILLVLSMIFTTGIQSVNFADNVEEGTKEQAEMTSLEEVKEEIEKGDPSLKLEVSLRDKPYKNGDTVEYEIRLKNDGEVDLENIKVKEDLNKEFLIKELKVKEEKLTNRKYKIDENNKLDEIKNKVEIEVNFDGKSLNYEGQFKLEVAKEDPKVEEVKEEPKEEPKREEAKQKEKKEDVREEPKEETKEDEKEETKEVEEDIKEETEANEEIEEEEEEYEFEKELEANREIGSDGPRIELPSYFFQRTNKMGTLSLTDTIAVNKTAKRSPGCRTFEVTLDITGTPQKAPVDVVLVIDRSGSMGFTATTNPTRTRLYYAKQAAINFAGRVLGPNGIPGSRVSVVSFSGPTSTSGYGSQSQASTNLNLSTNLTTVTNTINDISAVGGTNTEAGFKQGQAVIQGSTSNQNPNSNKVVVMLTDGLPTASNGNRYADTTNINHVHIQSAINAGKNIYQNDIADVFTIGLTTGMNATEKALADNILTQAQNKGYYPAPSATDLDAIFNAISQSLGYSATNANVVDKIGDNFDLVESSLPAGATYNAATREISWNPGTIVTSAQLKYVVVAKPEFPGGLADTNKFAKLTYKDIFGTAGKTKDFPIPKVNVPTLIKISLTDATIVSGDSISLGTGTDPLGENYMSPVTGGDNDGINFTYEWRKVGDSTVISTDKNPSVSPTEDTNYEVTVTDSNGCKAKATMWVRVTKKFDFGIKKIADKDTHKELLDGAKFVLKDEDELEVKSGITVDGYLWMNDLLPGTYTLQETEAPVGYKLNSQVYTITIAANGTITVSPNLTIIEEEGKKVLVVENDLLEFNIRLKKVDKDGESLDGAEFELKKDGVVIPTAATVGGYIDLNNLLAGAYTLQETVAPIGYELNSQVYTITIAANGDITIDPELEIVTENDKKVIVVKNDLLEFDIGLKKIDKKTGALLDGAKFKWTKDGVETELNVVDGYIDIDNLLAGTYTLEETKAPDGYKLDKTKYTVTISATGQVTVDPELTIETVEGRQVIVVENSEKGVFPSTGGPGTMIFIILGIGLMLISLVGYRNGGLKMKKNKKFLSLLIALVMVLSIASPILATGTAGKTGSLTIHKLYFPNEIGTTIDGTGEEQTSPEGTVPLAGAKFTIWKVADDAEIGNPGNTGTGTEMVTDANGLAVFSNLAYGRYYVEETFKPAGVTQGSVPFMVDIPTTSVDGTRLIDDVHVYPKNVLTLAKAQMKKVKDDVEPLAGAIFSLYKEIGGTADDLLIQSGLTTAADTGLTPIVENLEVGKYYFIETKAPEGYLKDTTKQEFIIASGDHDKLFEKTLTNYEKPGEPKKEVDKTNAGIGDKVTWTIKTQLPGNIHTYEAYKITDNLDAALNYDNNVVVTLAGAPLTAGTHYNLTAPDKTGGGTLIINFVPAKLSAGELIITFDTIVNENAVAGTDIENKAILDYNNGFEVGSEETPIVKVKVGGHKFIKVDNKLEIGLEGAEFIVRRSDDKYLIKDNDGMISWGTKADAFKFVSEEDGRFAVEGVAFGTYFLEETKAPDGYAKLQNPKEFTVSANTHETELPIVNKTKPGMPQTGGMGTLAFTAIGLAFMGLAAKTYKKEEK